MEREYILDNVEHIDAESLFSHIHQGIVTLEELMRTGRLDYRKRDKIEKMILSSEDEEDVTWERVRYGNELDLRDYIQKYPNGKHVREAKENIEFLEQERERKEKEKQRIIDELRKNSNFYSPKEIRDYLADNTITTDDLLGCGIPREIIEFIHNIKSPRLQLGVKPESIPEGFTEVYFWGIPGSGKTCALAAILSTAQKEGYLEFSAGPGFDYMTKLRNIFIDSKASLPPPSPIDITQYLPFTLKKENDRHPRSVSLIELSGEIFQCFYYLTAGQQLPSPIHQETFDTVLKFLKGKNRKIHFFFIDYVKGNRMDNDDLTQDDYLGAASTYFRNNDIFGKLTDAIYIVLTKSDLMPCLKEERVAFAIRHLQKNNYASFINSLKDRCKQHGINAGKLTVEPFSLGNVYFQQICDFDNSSAKRIIKILTERIKPSNRSVLGVFNR